MTVWSKEEYGNCCRNNEIKDRVVEVWSMGCYGKQGEEDIVKERLMCIFY
jgi:hypothetical protein